MSNNAGIERDRWFDFIRLKKIMDNKKWLFGPSGIWN